MKCASKIIFAGLVLAVAAGLTACSDEGSSGNGASSIDYSQVGKTALGPKTSDGVVHNCGGGSNAWVTYGGTDGAAFISVTKAIIADVGALLGVPHANTLGTSFDGAGSGTMPSNVDDLTTFTGKLNAFLIFQYGGPSIFPFPETYTNGGSTQTIQVPYNGIQGMQAAHKGFGITLAQYNFFVTNGVVPALSSVLTAAYTPSLGAGPAAAKASSEIGLCFAPLVSDPMFMNSIIGQ